MQKIPKLFIVAAAVFFTMGLFAAPIMGMSDLAFTLYKFTLYMFASVVFWLWLYRDASAWNISVSNQLLVGVTWLAAALLVAPIYLLASRGWRSGTIAVLVFFGLVISLFTILGVGMFLSVQIVNAIHP